MVVGIRVGIQVGVWVEFGFEDNAELILQCQYAAMGRQGQGKSTAVAVAWSFPARC